VEELIATTDLRAFRAAVAALDAEQRNALRQALERAGSEEPTHLHLQQGVPLADRMRTPATVLMRQVRLEKLRILAEG